MTVLTPAPVITIQSMLLIKFHASLFDYQVEGQSITGLKCHQQQVVRLREALAPHAWKATIVQDNGPRKLFIMKLAPDRAGD